jgi:hypothetical protein
MLPFLSPSLSLHVHMHVCFPPTSRTRSSPDALIPLTLPILACPPLSQQPDRFEGRPEVVGLYPSSTHSPVLMRVFTYLA